MSDLGNLPRDFEEWFAKEHGGMTAHSFAKIFSIRESKKLLGLWELKQKEIDQLKDQLNNMEACYIEKKKRVELLESNINNLTKQFSDCYEVAYAEYKKNADSYYSGKCDAFDLAEQLAGLALRGES